MPVAHAAAGSRRSLPRLLTCWAWSGSAALFLVLSLTPLTNNDTWLHLANGRWILEHGQVPLTDPYSFSAEGNRFHAHEWLAGVVLYLVHRIGGVPGLILFKTLLAAGALAISLRTARRLGAGGAVLAACFLLALVVVNPRFLERPEMFSFLFTAIYLLWMVRQRESLERLRAGGGTREGQLTARLGLWPLVPVQWIWVQMHGYFLTGLAMVGTFVAAETVVDAWRRRRGEPTAGWRRLGSGWAALAAMGLVGLVNPNGLEIYTFPFRLAGGDNIFMRTVLEWQPAFTTPQITEYSFFAGFCLWLGLLAVGCAVDGRPPGDRAAPWRATALAGLGGLLGLRALIVADLTLPRALAALTAGAGLQAAPVHWSTGLAPSTWLWSPAELLGTLTARPGLRAALDGALAPLRLLGPWGDDLFTLLWLGLVVALAVRWRRPRAAAVAIVAVLLALLYSRAGGWAAPVLALTLLPALALAVRRGRAPLWLAATAALFLALSVRQNRNIANFVFVTLPLLAPVLDRLRASLAPSRGPGHRGLAFTGLAAWTLVGLTVTTGWPYTSQEVKTVGLGIGPRAPLGAVDYIRERGLGGRVFNKYSYGAYLIHALYPQTRVFMDSRNGVYGEELYRLYLATLADEAQAARTFERYGFDYVLLDYEFYPGRSEDAGLLAYLRRRPEWVLAYFDDASVLYLRSTPSRAELIAQDGYRVLDPVAFRPGAFGGPGAASLPILEQESRRALDRQPAARSTRLLRAEVHLAAGRPREAQVLLEAVVADRPEDLYSRVAAGRVAARLGETARAAVHLRYVLGLRPGYEAVRDELRRIESADP